jgi:hypothetical protein
MEVGGEYKQKWRIVQEDQSSQKMGLDCLMREINS